MRMRNNSATEKDSIYYTKPKVVMEHLKEAGLDRVTREPLVLDLYWSSKKTRLQQRLLQGVLPNQKRNLFSTIVFLTIKLRQFIKIGTEQQRELRDGRGVTCGPI